MIYKRVCLFMYDLIYATEWLQQIAETAWIMTRPTIIVVVSQKL